MGSRPSTPNSPGEAIGSQTRTGHPVRGRQSSNVFGIRRGAGGAECVDDEVSGPEEITLGYGDYQERREWAGYNPRLPCAYDLSGYPTVMGSMREADDEARGDLDGAVDVSQGGIHLEDGMVHDGAFDDEYLSSIGDESAYCRAAADMRSAAQTTSREAPRWGPHLSVDRVQSCTPIARAARCDSGRLTSRVHCRGQQGYVRSLKIISCLFGLR